MSRPVCVCVCVCGSDQYRRIHSAYSKSYLHRSDRFVLRFGHTGNCVGREVGGGACHDRGRTGGSLCSRGGAGHSPSSLGLPGIEARRLEGERVVMWVAAVRANEGGSIWGEMDDVVHMIGEYPLTCLHGYECAH